MIRRGFSLVEVLVALTLVAVQTPMVVAAIGTAAALTRQAEAVLAGLEHADLLSRCGPP